MVNFAIKDTEWEGLTPYLEGPTAVAFCYDEATKAANLINKQFKEMPLLEFKAGIVEGVVYDAAGMAIIADIPSKEVLISRLLGSWKSPIASFARVLNAIAEKDGTDKAPSNETASATDESTPEPPEATATEAAEEGA
jgi:large subunit ribosomal protein L10